MKKILFIGLVVIGAVYWFMTTIVLYEPVVIGSCPVPSRTTWEVQSIDTMKSSRDHLRQKVYDQSYLDSIPLEIRDIQRSGATHVAIDVPYDEEFRPLLRLWVGIAREHDLNVWFRGNWAGWEGWYEYNPITPEEHTEKTDAFIRTNGDLFADGDIFSSCPECENGVIGDPRATKDVAEYRNFLITQYDMMADAFDSIDTEVDYGSFSMNGDVAQLIMDEATTEALGGIVVIDHYVKTPEQLDRDITAIAHKSGGRVILGEIGVPLNSLHGEMSEQEQGDWVYNALELLRHNPNLVGFNYWVSRGGATALWNDDHSPRAAAQHVSQVFSPHIVQGVVVDELNQVIGDADVSIGEQALQTTQEGCFDMILTQDIDSIRVSADGYEDVILHDIDPDQYQKIVMQTTNTSWRYIIRKKLLEYFVSDD